MQSILVKSRGWFKSNLSTAELEEEGKLDWLIKSGKYRQLREKSRDIKIAISLPVTKVLKPISHIGRRASIQQLQQTTENNRDLDLIGNDNPGVMLSLGKVFFMQF